MKKFYFDYAATTPMDERVIKSMAPYYSEFFGNPSSLHKFGQEASAAVFRARNKIAKLINCDYREIIFTGSATEANNLAIRGVVKSVLNEKQVLDVINESEQAKRSNKRSDRTTRTFLPRIITSVIEHESILETCRDLEKDGVEVIYLPVNKDGLVDLKKFEEALNERTVLVSIMYANNEVGSVQPIIEIAKVINDFRNSKLETRNSKQIQNSKIENYKNKISDFEFRISNFETTYPLFHTDVAQAFNYLDCDVKNLGVDMMTLSSQKIYGPKGVGLLHIQDTRLVSPIVTGGGQEEGLRAGTENVAGIVGFSEAADLISNSRELENDRLVKLQEYFWKNLKNKFPGVVLNGPKIGENRLPNNLNVYFKGQKDLIYKLDMAGFAVSGGSACSAHLAKPSHVLKAMGCSDEKASESIRISFGRQTTKDAIDRLIKVLYHILKLGH